MADNHIIKNQPITIYNVNGTRILKYQQEIQHKGLNEHKIISASTLSMLENKVKVQIENWTDKWNKALERKKICDNKKASAEEADLRTSEAEKNIAEVENILIYTLGVNDAIDWDNLKKKENYPESFPLEPSKPELRSLEYYISKEPKKDSAEYQPKFNILTKIFKSLESSEIIKAETKFNNAYKWWENNYNNAQQENKMKTDQYEEDINKYNNDIAEWNKRKDSFIKEQNEYNQKIDELKLLYMNKDLSAILEYCELVLNRSELPELFKKDFELEYNTDTKILIIDYLLPNIEDLPNIKEVKYLVSKDQLKETYFNNSFMEKIYDATIYRLILRILHEEFEADVANAIDAISLNGWVEYLNKATGNPEKSCIVSIMVKKEEFIQMDLRNVDPKACFKNLKGIGSAKLAGITPIKPILTIDRNDKRFVNSYDVAKNLDDTTNLATIPWEDFEHLVRELFQAEFSSNGGEVKVTQASRDGGVDAIAFDPDPIRGGKIVIQAKRYANTVGVSAVRDLYGTLVNEGATKGILVTTSDYGPDAYEFSKNKPITLLNGGHLLSLLEKNGHKAKIDLKEAREINMMNNK